MNIRVKYPSLYINMNKRKMKVQICKGAWGLHYQFAYREQWEPWFPNAGLASLWNRSQQHRKAFQPCVRHVPSYLNIHEAALGRIAPFSLFIVLWVATQPRSPPDNVAVCSFLSDLVFRGSCGQILTRSIFRLNTCGNTRWIHCQVSNN